MYLIVNIQGMNCDFVIRQTFQIVSTVFHSVSGFFFGSSLLDWESARIDCERRGMRLVCLKNHVWSCQVLPTRNTGQVNPWCAIYLDNQSSESTLVSWFYSLLYDSYLIIAKSVLICANIVRSITVLYMMSYCKIKFLKVYPTTDKIKTLHTISS